MKNLVLKNLAISILVGLLLIILGIMHANAQQLEFVCPAPTATMEANNNARAITHVWNGAVIPFMNDMFMSTRQILRSSGPQLTATGNIDIHRAVVAVFDYFKNPATI